MQIGTSSWYAALKQLSIKISPMATSAPRAATSPRPQRITPQVDPVYVLLISATHVPCGLPRKGHNFCAGRLFSAKSDPLQIFYVYPATSNPQLTKDV